MTIDASNFELFVSIVLGGYIFIGSTFKVVVHRQYNKKLLKLSSEIFAVAEFAKSTEDALKKAYSEETRIYEMFTEHYELTVRDLKHDELILFLDLKTGMLKGLLFNILKLDISNNRHIEHILSKIKQIQKEIFSEASLRIAPKFATLNEEANFTIVSELNRQVLETIKDIKRNNKRQRVINAFDRALFSSLQASCIAHNKYLKEIEMIDTINRITERNND